MYYWRHAGIALATSISSWIGVIIYLLLLIKSGKILKSGNNQFNKHLSYSSLVVYSFKIFMVSLIMLAIMKLLSHVSLIYQINEILSISLLVIFGLLTYVLTTFILGYIPQQLLNFYISKFKKAK